MMLNKMLCGGSMLRACRWKFGRTNMLDNVSLIVSDLDGQVTEMESLIADIKSVVESPYASDTIKVERVIKTIKDYGY